MPAKNKKFNDSGYAKVMEDYKYRLSQAKNNQERANIFDEFSKNYFMPKPLWKAASKFTHSRRNYWDNKFNKEAIYQFYYDENIIRRLFFSEDLRIKLIKGFLCIHVFYGLNLRNKYEYTREVDHLKFPNNKLRENYMSYEQYSASPINIEYVKTVEKRENLYEKIKAAENNLEEWIKYLLEADDHEFVCHNIENRIRRNLKSKKLWKWYIEYLRETDPKEMLQVYSKYCRFFLDDTKMLEEYKDATEKYGPVFVPWKNLFDFENPFPPDEDKKKTSKPSVPLKSRSIFVNPPFNTLMISKQFWSLPMPMITAAVFTESIEFFDFCLKR